MLKAAPVGLVILVLVKVNPALEPLTMSTPASPPFSVTVPLKL